MFFAKVETLLVLQLLLFVLVGTSCQAQTPAHKKADMEMEEHKHDPLLCDPEKGLCEIPGTGEQSENLGGASLSSTQKSISVVYFTDPICSSCWGIEAQLRKLKLEYGSSLSIEYRMGGLLPDWSYNSGGISQPSDVAHHWDEVSGYYDMPIDGDVWLEDPLESSYPPSIAFKAAQLQDEQKALLWLREIREMVFLQKKNITKWEYIAEAARKVGLDVDQFKADYEGKAEALFQEDLQLGRELRVRGFPTLFFTDTAGKTEIIYGAKPYKAYETVVMKLDAEAASNKADYDKSSEGVFSIFETLTAREFSELTETPREKAEAVLDKLVADGKLLKFETKNGSIWRRSN